MWRAEDKWGQLTRDENNARHPEANMLLRAIDKEVIGLHNLCDGKKGKEVVQNALKEGWGTYDAFLSGSVMVSYEEEPGVKQSAGMGSYCNNRVLAFLHKLYQSNDPEFCEWWQSFVSEEAARLVQTEGWTREMASHDRCTGWSFHYDVFPRLHEEFECWGRRKFAAREFSVDQLYQTMRFYPDVLLLKKITMDGVTFEKGSWLCSRPSDDDVHELPNVREGLPRFGVPRQLWFGKVQGMFLHRRRRAEGGNHEEDVGQWAKEYIFHVQWYKSVSPCPYDVGLQSPVICNNERTDLDDPFVSTKTVLPLHMVARPYGRNNTVLISRTWQPMGALNMPVPWPKLMQY